MLQSNREVKREEVLSWDTEGYIKNYKAWAENADVGDTLSEVYGDEWMISPAEAKNLLEAYEKGEEIFKKPLEIKDVGKVGHRHPIDPAWHQGTYITIGGVEYPWPVARAIISYFFNNEHVNFLSRYDLTGITVNLTGITVI
jgi:hypothetical protein